MDAVGAHPDPIYRACPPVPQLLDCWLLTVHGCLFLWRITLSRMGALIWEVMLPYLPTGYGQWLTDTGVWKAGFFAFRWYYLLVQCVLQNSPWDRVEARVPSETPWLRRSSSCPSLLPHSFLPQEITCPKSHLRLGFQGTQFKTVISGPWLPQLIVLLLLIIIFLLLRTSALHFTLEIKEGDIKTQDYALGKAIRRGDAGMQGK